MEVAHSEKLYSIFPEFAEDKIVGIVEEMSDPRSSLTSDIMGELDYMVDHMRWLSARIGALERVVSRNGCTVDHCINLLTVPITDNSSKKVKVEKVERRVKKEKNKTWEEGKSKVCCCISDLVKHVPKILNQSLLRVSAVRSNRIKGSISPSPLWAE